MILVICPSRGRPGSVRQMWASMQMTAARPDTRLLIAIDADDPCRDEYLRIIPETDTRRFGIDIDRPIVRVLQPEQTGNMTKAMNSAVAPFMDGDLILGMVNDDHRFRTQGWDRRVEETLATPGITYGDDLFQGESLVCGGVFINAPIVKALGYYCLPVCEHLFVDNAWGDIGRATRSLTYLPDVVIEHLHPLAGKGVWDEGYERANNQGVIDRDRTAYERWRDGGGLEADAMRVMDVLRRNGGWLIRTSKR